jgi:hypothetical protein
MIRNGLYSYSITMLDGVAEDGTGVMVLRDTTLCGGNSFYYFNGSYECSGDKWKGELTSSEHALSSRIGPFARKTVTVGFSGTYVDDGAQFDAVALSGKRSMRGKVTLQLLMAH